MNKKINFYFYGWIWNISSVNFTKNKIAYKKIRCCSYKNQWWTFLIFETTPNYQKLKKGNWIRLDGILTIENNNVYASVKSINFINKVDYFNETPNIENEELESIKMENGYEEF